MEESPVLLQVVVGVSEDKYILLDSFYKGNNYVPNYLIYFIITFLFVDSSLYTFHLIYLLFNYPVNC
jgi:hypothetical protein